MAGFNPVQALCLVLTLCLASAVHANALAKQGVSRLKYPHGYNLVDNYKMHNFFDKFRFFTHPDPTNGFVQYVDRHTANKTGLIRTYKNHTYVGVDHENVYDSSGPGRPSVRLESHKAYTHGLFILNLNHMPVGCGTWPAWWTLGPRWPYTGEIDIIEGVNKNKYNLMSLHTSEGCTIAGADQVGTLVTENCNSLQVNTGCGVLHNATKSYGKGFNEEGGGVYAMEWTANFIRVWKWSHKHVPKSIRKGRPDPEKDFGKPDANLAGSCNIDRHFREHYIVFDNTFCGDFAGASYGNSQCPYSSQGHYGCNEFVAKYPQAFKNAYWSINHLKVYQKHGSDVTRYKPKSYSSVIPQASATPSIFSSLLPPGNGHNTTANHVPTSLTVSLRLSTASPSRTSSRSLSTTKAIPTGTASETSSAESSARRSRTAPTTSSRAIPTSETPRVSRRPASESSSTYTYTRRPLATRSTSTETAPRQTRSGHILKSILGLSRTPSYTASRTARFSAQRPSATRGFNSQNHQLQQSGQKAPGTLHQDHAGKEHGKSEHRKTGHNRKYKNHDEQKHEQQHHDLEGLHDDDSAHN